jgi:hypothetical protein
MNIYNKYGLEHRNAFFALRAAQWTDFDDFWEKYSAEKNQEFRNHIQVLAQYFEGIAIMLQQGYLDMEIVEPICGQLVREFWMKMGQVIGGIRERWNVPTAFREAEYLYNEVEKYYQKHPELNP